MAPKNVNLLISAFPGLGLPSTLVVPLRRDALVTDVWDQLCDRLPPSTGRLILTTSSNKQLPTTSSFPIRHLLSSDEDEILPLRLAAPLCGGKGGFGSQLRAAGGRMSSRKKRNQGDNNGSSRNLDGRRLRTVNEAKALAEYLSLKPEMERKQKEQRRQRLEQIVEMAERRKDEARNGSKGQIDTRWREDREDAAERTRGAVLAVMSTGSYKDNMLGTSHSSSSSNHEPGSGEDNGKNATSSRPNPPSASKQATTPNTGPSKRNFFGFEEEDEFMSSESDE